MFNNKRIYSFTGPTCSGKSFMASMINPNHFDVISIDDEVDRFYKEVYPHKTKDEMLSDYGITGLENLTYRAIRERIMLLIQMSKKENIIVDGVQATKLLVGIDNVIDCNIDFTSTSEFMDNNRIGKNWSKKKYHKIRTLKMNLPKDVDFTGWHPDAIAGYLKSKYGS